MVVALMMAAVSTSETSVLFNKTTPRTISEDCHLHSRRRQNLKSHKMTTWPQTQVKRSLSGPAIGSTIDSFTLLATGYCYRVVSYKVSRTLRSFLNYCASNLSSNTLDSSTSALWLHQRHLAVKKVFGEKVLEFCWRSMSIVLCKLLLRAIKSYDTGLPALLPIRSKVCCGFLSPLAFWSRSSSK
jgi:hypothetical protein